MKAEALRSETAEAGVLGASFGPDLGSSHNECGHFGSFCQNVPCFAKSLTFSTLTMNLSVALVQICFVGK